MLRHAIDFLKKRARLPLLIPCILAFAALAVLIGGKPFGLAALRGKTGGIGILDMELLYTPTQGYTQLEALGPGGRAFYRNSIQLLDLFYPVAYGLTLSLAIAELLREDGRWMADAAILVPLATWAFDWMENIAIFTALTAWPARIDALLALSSAAGMLKWAGLTMSLAALAAACVVRVLALVKKAA
ncbi:MAG: hypothetical protein NT080_03270 [Spirochaetes bacterium]|nr:hypothetical protein [Spirochaetota bacterium]